ncbi:hypothetical protein DUNSADRAFT_18713 [Dunaliella salina]|uniref:Uncharacterized protein n=1 Tax=Dunaliella salina TaxID=3046 RepID=A0ABQ7FZK8_DUNSA|nr:hypothetical protein DUNSADRAFT_18713 [Dunaliella salina]|eukprot:KAF5827798.1 hypothetical protein DUNSADRAFT_18713 [Dunaliella salina]
MRQCRHIKSSPKPRHKATCYLTYLPTQGILVPGLLDPKRNPVHVPELHGDFSLNVANTLSADLLLRGSSLSRIAPTHDLSAPQVCGLATSLGPSRATTSLKVILHQYLPIFHTEHCVFCRFLSSGNSYKDCGHPCEQHKVHLRNEKGADHLVLADMGCRNTVFNAQAQSGAFYVQDLVRAGVRKFRIELVDEQRVLVVPLVQGYRDLLDGSRSSGDLWTWMGSLSRAGKYLWKFGFRG